MQIDDEGIIGNFDLAHLKEIHEFLFSEIYDWAGKIRTVNISKGNQFCNVIYIVQIANDLFDELRKEKFLADLDSEKIAKRL
jgi:cell filamentation protein